jgi:hypothetical protein
MGQGNAWCQLIYPIGVTTCPTDFGGPATAPTAAGVGIVKSDGSSHGGSCYAKKAFETFWATFQADGYELLGLSHCVDISNKRPPSCWKGEYTPTQMDDCKTLCDGDDNCGAFEFGQVYGGILCQLVYPAGVTTCPSGFAQATLDGVGIAKADGTPTGGRCYVKKTYELQTTTTTTQAASASYCSLAGMKIFSTQDLETYFCTAEGEHKAIAFSSDCGVFGASVDADTQQEADAQAIDWCNGNGVGYAGETSGCQVQFRSSHCEGFVNNSKSQAVIVLEWGIDEKAALDTLAAESYAAKGGGHCVDSSDKRPSHCWKKHFTKTQMNDCKKLCDDAADCGGYEFGQLDFCILLYPAVDTINCPPGFQLATTGGGVVDGTDGSETAGRCFAKKGALPTTASTPPTPAPTP